ncbi:MAG: serine hydrolase domain-containing protein [Bacteroidales bacterium]
MFTNCSNQKELDSFKLETVMEDLVNKDNPGVLLNISSPAKGILYNGSKGYSDVKNGVKLKPNQIFRIASVTKTFVAATILRLWEDGEIRLDDPVGKYISQEHRRILKEGGYDPSQIKIYHLLTHSSGMAEHTTSHKFSLEFMKTHHVWTRTEQINDLIKYAKPVGEIGEKFSYSDSGYVLLGEIIEKVTGESMGDAIQTQLQLSKLGLKDTRMEEFNGDNSPRRIHQYNSNVDSYDFHPSLDYYGGGGLLSTTSDLSCFFLALFENKVFSKQSTLETMLRTVNYNSKQKMDYRMGIWKTEINGVEAYTHSGFWGTQVVYIPSIETAIAVNYSQHWPGKGNAPILEDVLKIIMKK